MRVVLIMSTFNAAMYLREQLDSLLSQRNVEIAIWARDDGSLDETRAILTEYGIAHPHGANMGAADSFMEATRTCPLTGDYYGFCDADDVWLDDKVSVAIEELQELEGPAMVCSTTILVDANLVPFGKTAVPRILSFRNAMVQCVTSGATILMNHSAFELMRSYFPSRGVIAMHDAWVYLLVSAFGSIKFYDKPGVLYRQHQTNVAGAGHSLMKKWERRTHRFITPKKFLRQATEFHSLFHQLMREDDRIALEKYIHYRRNRIWFAFFPSFQCQSRKADLYLRFLCLFGRG